VATTLRRTQGRMVFAPLRIRDAAHGLCDRRAPHSRWGRMVNPRPRSSISNSEPTSRR
jgi:hypothetical protein